MMKKILCVDDEPNNLQVLRQILKEHYQLIFAPNGTRALDAAAKHMPDMVLLDIMMPDISGYEVCEKLKADPRTKDITIIFVTAMSEVKDEAYGFDVGAVDYIQKPVSGAVVLRRVQTHLNLVRVQELEKSQRDAIFMLGEAGHYNDNDTGVHIWRMSAFARALAERAGWPAYMAERLELASAMHDTGKIGIPDSILKAPRKLTSEEWKVMQTHTEIGHRILSMSNSPIFTMAAGISLNHHEKWDGSGYPNGISGEDIPESARIVAIADVFDALTMKRPYKKAWSFEEARDEILKGAGGHFDPTLIELFESISSQFYEIKNKWDKTESLISEGKIN
ncbi:response regulator [Maridesulfovibrio salexigens]|uniref:Response regulator receiver modulated metal dependent phosphohydrolase n=1 Tax=Maridesulfovibrio salexigens (strain ATCC 14822 / DSM 2638 / NCIMB 8403 / VKM B-1763) TaxID=526222 RepID=C6C2B2_MARSD|nr:HD domain-containing phosphohydrolase [Maridesulfovibrio salexigens]ACS81313.1 response regulator receiver modulated metal dependent phosphohydrolase [Maridesulfovibrio salexigens DSM 2638]